MKVGLLSDIHGNADALSAVLAAARARGATRLICCGDFVGYYYEPARCFDLLAQWDLAAVRGNHENMFARLLADPSSAAGFTEQFGSGLVTAAAQLDGSRQAYLVNLPKTDAMTLGGSRVLVCHGAPWDTDFYVYPEASDEVIVRCAESGADVVVMGHTHCQMAARVGGTLLVNPGSVGQPRRGTGAAEWALLDLAAVTCDHYAEPYDTAPVAAAARAADPHFPFLWEILER